MKELVFFKDEFEVKVCLANLLEKVAYKEMEAISYALNKWDTLEKEAEITSGYIHNQNLEWDLLSFADRKEKERDAE